MITNSMQENSMNLAEYLNGILKLKPEDEHNNIPIEDIDNVKLLDSNILELATQHDLPIFISILVAMTKTGWLQLVCASLPRTKETQMQ